MVATRSIQEFSSTEHEYIFDYLCYFCLYYMFHIYQSLPITQQYNNIQAVYTVFVVLITKNNKNYSKIWEIVGTLCIINVTESEKVIFSKLEQFILLYF